MVTQQPSAGAPNLIERAKNILLTPRAEWDRIAGEPANTGAILMGYVLPLAALAAIAGVVGASVFGYGAGFGPFAVHVKVPIMNAVVAGAVQLVMALVCVFVMALIVNALAPTFGSQQDSGQALKLTAYSATASYLAGIFAIYPPLAPLGILGIYSLVLLYLGLPRLMKTPEDKRVGYFVTIIIVAIVVGVVAMVVFGAVRAALPGAPGLGGFSIGANSGSGGEVKIGGVTIDSGDAEKAASQLEQALGAAAAGGGSGATVNPSALQALLPDALPGGFARTSVSSSTAGAMGMNAAQAEAVYTNGDARIEVTIVHLGAMSGFGAMAAAAGVQAEEQTEDGFSRTRTVEGRVYNESQSRSAGTVSYSVVGKNGATLSVEGSGGVMPEQAAGALNAVGIARVEALGGS